ncbi:MAG TPA: R3H domain-containing nucleic acid-binding protein [bacterium]|nr:R3H domain-containing nucleic acid-binding protein [bacterium]HRY56546.1 R3H domain-containing nucleic acid-binding protein [Patescibacteria group bacterium]
MNKIFQYIGIKPELSVEEIEENNFNVTVSGDDLNFLIGFRGQSLDGLQNILRLMIYRETQIQPLITLDINDYKSRKTEKIQDMAKTFIDKVRFFQKDVEMPRMSPWERRQIHVLVSEYDDIESESTGEGEDRRVVLKPKKLNKGKKE